MQNNRTGFESHTHPMRKRWTATGGLALTGLIALAGFSGCDRGSVAMSPAPPTAPKPTAAAAPAESPTTVHEAVPHADSETNSLPAKPASIPVAVAATGQRPPADRGSARPGAAEKITFDDLNLQMQANVVYRPFMLTDRVQELEGQRISIIGYIHGAAAGTSGLKKFVLLKNTECKFGQDGQADHLAMVYLRNGTTFEFTTRPVKVEATLAVVPFEGPDGNTWSIYNLDDAVATVSR